MSEPVFDITPRGQAATKFARDVDTRIRASKGKVLHSLTVGFQSELDERFNEYAEQNNFSKTAVIRALISGVTALIGTQHKETSPSANPEFAVELRTAIQNRRKVEASGRYWHTFDISNAMHHALNKVATENNSTMTVIVVVTLDAVLSGLGAGPTKTLKSTDS